MTVGSAARFSFGANWQSYARSVMDADRLASAQKSLAQLMGTERLDGRSLLDVGCGTGLFAAAAWNMGARPVVGVDIDPLCVEIAGKHAVGLIRGSGGAESRPRFEPLDILNTSASLTPSAFDVVYAWGSLHHTGHMYDAIRNAAARVKSGGMYVLAIYNRHWTSPVWKVIKIIYNLSPKWLRKVWAAFFAAVIYLAKYAVTGKDPLKMERGMDFYHDVVDWIGGYPYEYASVSEITVFVQTLGFKTVRTVAARVPTGCNEFIFTRLP